MKTRDFKLFTAVSLVFHCTAIIDSITKPPRVEASTPRAVKTSVSARCRRRHRVCNIFKKQNRLKTTVVSSSTFKSTLALHKLIHARQINTLAICWRKHDVTIQDYVTCVWDQMCVSSNCFFHLDDIVATTSTQICRELFEGLFADVMQSDVAVLQGQYER